MGMVQIKLRIYMTMKGKPKMKENNIEDMTT